jgi:hypothetical protein
MSTSFVPSPEILTPLGERLPPAGHRREEVRYAVG